VIDEKETQGENKVDSAGPHTLQVGIRMQQGEHTGQPIYSNFTAVQGGQGVVFVDFGFLEPQALQSLARMTQSGEKAPETIGARMSSRMASSVDAAANLARQLNQLLQPKAVKAVETGLGNEEDVTLQ
jgi:hypothetical protein